MVLFKFSFAFLILLQILAIKVDAKRLHNRPRHPRKFHHIRAKQLGMPHQQIQRKKHSLYEETKRVNISQRSRKSPVFDYYYFQDVEEELGQRKKRQDYENDEQRFKDTEKQKNFNNWKAWQVYDQCNLTINPYLSPVDIPTKTASRINTTALKVYAKHPKPKTYQISSQYTYEGIRMEAFAIRRINDDVMRDTTYISGLGSQIQRFFVSALIMVHPKDDTGTWNFTDDGMIRSLHRIDGKGFPMEVMINFLSNNFHNPEKTQIHVMVELSDTDNPAWTPIIEMLRIDVQDKDTLWEHVRTEGCVGTKKLDEVEQKYGKASRKHTLAKGKRKKLIGHQNYDAVLKELQDLYDSIKDATPEEIEKVSSEMTKKSTELDACQEKLDATKAKMSSNSKNTEVESLNSETGSKSQTNRGKLKKSRNEKDDLMKQVTAMRFSCDKIEEEKVYLENELERLKNALKEHHIGTPGSKYESIEDVNSALKTLVEIGDKFKQAYKEYKKYDAILNNLHVRPQRSATITQPFQISWLFPPIGGYYIYRGTSVAPPCNRRAYQIVLEKPITISKAQMLYFLNFPSIFTTGGIWKSDGLLCDQAKYDLKTTDKGKLKAMKDFVSKMDTIKDQVPVIYPWGTNRMLQYNKKNLQFLLDDGFHMNSKLRWKIKHGKA